ncbi:MAG: carboxypeptidase regulatory-like domain-containing protein [Gemmatimonadetes bacterium]|nr:carboxypeptidase regulatory-like domain-containing protein [Gemmatimonadota bacterium]
MPRPVLLIAARPSRGLGRRLGASAFACALLFPGALAAQGVHGKVLEIPGNRPVPEATVLLFSDSITVAAQTKTDAEGNYSLKAPRLGTYSIRVRKVGYTGGETGTFNIAVADSYELNIKTPRVTPVLAGVKINEKAVPRGYEWLQGFEERRKQGIGTFITQQEINDKNSPSVGELLRGVPGVGVEPGPNGWYLLTSQRGGRSIENSACLMDVYLDGIPMDQEAIHRTTRPVDLEAIEVYHGPATVPSQFKKQMTGSCGAILLWTRVRNQRYSSTAVR